MFTDRKTNKAFQDPSSVPGTSLDPPRRPMPAPGLTTRLTMPAPGAAAPSLTDITAAMSATLEAQVTAQKKVIKTLIREELLASGGKSVSLPEPGPALPSVAGIATASRFARSMSIRAERPVETGEKSYTSLLTGDLITLRIGGPRLFLAPPSRVQSSPTVLLFLILWLPFLRWPGALPKFATLHACPHACLALPALPACPRARSRCLGFGVFRVPGLGGGEHEPAVGGRGGGPAGRRGGLHSPPL